MQRERNGITPTGRHAKGPPLVFGQLLVCRQSGNYPETGLEEINGDLLEEDLRPGMSFRSRIRVEAIEPASRSGGCGNTSKKLAKTEDRYE